MSNEPQSITLSDGNVWKYNPAEKGIAAWRCPALMPNSYYAEPRLGPDMRGISILTAADHRAIADVLDPPAREVTP